MTSTYTLDEIVSILRDGFPFETVVQEDFDFLPGEVETLVVPLLRMFLESTVTEKDGDPLRVDMLSLDFDHTDHFFGREYLSIEDAIEMLSDLDGRVIDETVIWSLRYGAQLFLLSDLQDFFIDAISEVFPKDIYSRIEIPVTDD